MDMGPDVSSQIDGYMTTISIDSKSNHRKDRHFFEELSELDGDSDYIVANQLGEHIDRMPMFTHDDKLLKNVHFQIRVTIDKSGTSIINSLNASTNSKGEWSATLNFEMDRGDRLNLMIMACIQANTELYLCDDKVSASFSYTLAPDLSWWNLLNNVENGLRAKFSGIDYAFSNVLLYRNNYSGTTRALSKTFISLDSPIELN
jgi:hypothetical protein